jgi:hypothetical protein
MDKYWIIPKRLVPKEEIDVLDFLRESGYKVGNIKVGTRDISYEDSVIGEVYEDTCRIDINWPEKFDPDRIEKISKLITLLEVNDIPYFEKPERVEILDIYEEQANESLDTIREL